MNTEHITPHRIQNQDGQTANAERHKKSRCREEEKKWQSTLPYECLVPAYTTRGQLWRAWLANPRDDAPRLIYADWLEENEAYPTHIIAALREPSVVDLIVAISSFGLKASRKLVKSHKSEIRYVPVTIAESWLGGRFVIGGATGFRFNKYRSVEASISVASGFVGWIPMYKTVSYHISLGMNSYKSVNYSDRDYRFKKRTKEEFLNDYTLINNDEI